MAEEKQVAKVKEPVAKEPKKSDKVNKVDFLQRPVRFYAFKDNSKYKDAIYCSWNDRSFLIKRGEEVEIPYGAYLILKRSMSQDSYSAKLIDGLSNDYKNKGL